MGNLLAQTMINLKIHFFTILLSLYKQAQNVKYCGLLLKKNWQRKNKTEFHQKKVCHFSLDST